MKSFTEKENRDAIRAIFNPEKYGYDWFNKEDLLDAMRSALLIRIVADIADLSRGEYIAAEGGGDINEYRNFFASILARKPFPTTHRWIIDMVAAASQMVEKTSWERREELISAFLINNRKE